MRHIELTNQTIGFLHISMSSVCGYYDMIQAVRGIPPYIAYVNNVWSTPQLFQNSVLMGHIHRLGYDSDLKMATAETLATYIKDSRKSQANFEKNKRLLGSSQAISGHHLANCEIAKSIVKTNVVVFQEESCSNAQQYYEALPLKPNFIIDRGSSKTMIFVLDCLITGKEYSEVYKSFEYVLTNEGTTKRNLNKTFASPNFYITGATGGIYPCNQYCYHISDQYYDFYDCFSSPSINPLF